MSVYMMQPSDELLLRAVQLCELLPIRTGVMLLGPAAGGKTTVRQVLQLALSKDGHALQCTHIYPKVSHSHLGLAKTYNLHCIRRSIRCTTCTTSD